jgi:hypothetical protein
MRRWLIATFALYVLVNLGVFASGQAIAAATSEPTQLTASLLESAAPALDSALLGHAPDHGLTDTSPELPEWLHLKLVPLSVPGNTAVPVATLRRPVAPPTLDGLQRPPRATTRA